MPDLRHELIYVLRSLRRGGVATFVAVATLAVGLVGTTSLFVVTRAILFAPLPAEDPSHVVALSRTSEEARDAQMPIPHFFDWAERNRTLESIGGYQTDVEFNLEGSPSLRVRAAAVTSGFFPTLGVEPLVGEAFGAGADAPGAERRVILAHELWHVRFGGDREIVGETLRLDGEPWQVVGVMPAEFRFPGRDVDLWVPLGAQVPAQSWNQRAVSVLYAVGRISDGTDAGRVQDDLDRVTESIAEETGVRPQPRPLVVPLPEKLLGPIRGPLALLGLAVLLVLAIACANVAHLLLARGYGRRQEIAVRGALGAPRGHVVRLFLLESVLLALVAVGVALAFTAPVARTLMASMPAAFAAAEIPVWNPEILAFGAVLALITGILFGLVPAIRFSKVPPAQAMRQGQKSVVTGHRTQSALVVAEVAVAVVLLVGAGLVLRSLGGLLDLDAGFEPEGLLVLRLDPPPGSRGDLDGWLRFTEEILRETRALPAAETSALSFFLPLEGNGAGDLPLTRVARPGQALRPDVLPLGLTMTVTPGFFDAFGVEVVEGRLFEPTDDLEHPLVAVIDRGLAETFWPGESAVGRRVAFEFRFPSGDYSPGEQVEPVWREVVGVVETVRYEGLRGEPRLQIYSPMAQPPIYYRGGQPPLALAVETRADPLSLGRQVRSALAGIDPGLPVYDQRTMQEVVDEHLAEERLLARQLGLFGLLALLLAAAGVYAALAQLVARRTREMGLRQALGASPGLVLRQVATRGLKLSVWGVALGLAASLYLGRLLESRLYGIEPRDPVTLLAAPAILLAVALVSCLVPAWRASKLDPQECLRYE